MGRAINRRRGAGGGATDYSNQYLTIVSLRGGNTIRWYCTDSSVAATLIVMRRGVTTTVTSTTEGAELGTLGAGEKMYIRCPQNISTYSDGTNYNHFKATSNFALEGNIMSLLYYDSFWDKTSLPNYTYTFYRMFHYVSQLSDISNLVMPATTLRQGCYERMFQGTSITSLPEGLLPATTLAPSCYYYMFYETSITEIPSGFLPATTLAANCYYGMFEYAPITTLPSGLLPASTLADSCYREMFYSCTGLTTVASDLMGATTLASACCRGMFSACSALTTPPDLNAATLVTECYRVMFYNCSSLNYVKCLATNISASNATYSWLTGRKDGGTFYAKSGVSWPSNNSGIPTTWTRVNV